MTSATLTTSFDLATQPKRPIRRAEAQRRAYLDTYAKRRSIAAVEKAANHPERVQATVASIPMHMDVPYVPVKTQKIEVKELSPQVIRALSRRAIALSRSRNVMQQPLITAQQAVGRTNDQFSANLDALYKPSLTEQLQHADTKSASHVRTVVLSALTCGILTLSMFAFLTRVDSQPVVAQPIGAAVIEVEAPVARQAPRGQSAPAVAHVASKPTDPVKIVISSIGVNADIHGLGTNEKGEIAVPKAYGLVGWYNKGKTVSEAGPTVLVGHYAGGGGAVFDRLAEVKNGDLVTVTTKEGKSYTYKVSKKVEYQKDKVPMQQIFKAGESSRLEIITCQGAWAGNTYDNRLVVTAELVR